MINRVRRFFKLRKQSDTVKIICIFAIVGAAFLCNTVYHVYGIYHYVNTPVEYVLTTGEVVKKVHVDELLQSEEVMRVSRQMMIPVTLTYQGIETTVSCTMLSQEYVEGMFDTELSASTRKFYMNEAAFQEWKNLLSEGNDGMPDLADDGQAYGDTELDIRYHLPEESSKSAKLIVAENGEEDGFVCVAEDDSRLLKEACSLRVQFGTHDLDGLHVDKLRKLGFEIENEEVVIEEEYEIKERLLHIKYGLFCSALCLVFTIHSKFGLSVKSSFFS